MANGREVVVSPALIITEDPVSPYPEPEEITIDPAIPSELGAVAKLSAPEPALEIPDLIEMEPTSSEDDILIADPDPVNNDIVAFPNPDERLIDPPLMFSPPDMLIDPPVEFTSFRVFPTDKTISPEASDIEEDASVSPERTNTDPETEEAPVANNVLPEEVL